jgi:hypothetical protein
MPERLQIRIEFNAAEDRLLLRISERESNGTCAEYRCWLTRRYANICIRAIERIIDDELANDMQISPDAVEPMRKFQQEAALSKADFFTSFDTGAGDGSRTWQKPLLCSALKVCKKGKGVYVLSFLGSDNGGLHLRTGIELMYTLQKMLLISAAKAAWNEPFLRARSGEAATAETPAFTRFIS